MTIDYSSVDQVFELSFGKLNRASSRMDFPEPGSFSEQLARLVTGASTTYTIPHSQWQMLASASIEMWHRSIHSFLWSVWLSQASPLWASITGYYASHFAMRAFAHSLGFFRSFRTRKTIQVVLHGGHFRIQEIRTRDGEHAFYWKAIKGHSHFAANPLFRVNSERDPRSDSSHRTFANYTDHVNHFAAMTSRDMKLVSEDVEKISRIRLHSVTEPSRDNYPDLQNVQILAFQRIVSFADFIDERIPNNRFWRIHRRPAWCRGMMLFQVEEPVIESPANFLA